jgi:hypothetical protein
MNEEDFLDETIKSLEDFFFGEGPNNGESLFINFAKKNKNKFKQANISKSTENNFEFTELHKEFQKIYEKKIEEIINKNKMSVDGFYNCLSKRCDEGDQEILLFVDIINEIINYNSFIEMMANLINKI